MGRPLRSWVQLAAVLVLALCGSGSGCFFEPRTPEQGGTTVCFQPIPADQEHEVFFNLDGALQCKLSQSYQVQFGEDYLFTPAPSVAASFDVFDEPWDLDQEKLFSDRLFATADSIVSDLRQDVDTGTIQGADPISYEANYYMRYKPNNGVASVYRARAKFTLATVGGTFRLIAWEDQEPVSGELTLGQLRGELLSQ